LLLTVVIPGYTRRMKTAISIPDDTFNEAERHAAELGMSRSEFFTTAARHYIQELDAQSLTARINAALALAGSDESSQAAVRAGRRVLADGDDW
jgi:antitoxin MazE6